MYLADYHIHSDCSGDGTASMADMAAAAVAAGLREVCFTDHLDVPRAGEQPYPLDTQRLLEQLPPLDFIIGSRHLLHRRFGPLRGFTQVDRVADRWDEAIEDYLAELLAQVRWGRFSVLGHLTLPLRYAVERFGMEVSFAGHMDSVEQEIIALGSDAHRPQHVGLGIREGRQLLQACGFSYVCTFEKMQPIFHKL